MNKLTLSEDYVVELFVVGCSILYGAQSQRLTVFHLSINRACNDDQSHWRLLWQWAFSLPVKLRWRTCLTGRCRWLKLPKVQSPMSASIHQSLLSPLGRPENHHYIIIPTSSTSHVGGGGFCCAAKC